MNQWLGGGVERAYGYAARHSPPKWAGPLVIYGYISDYISNPSSLTPRFAIETPQQLDWTSCSDQLADPVYPLLPSGDDLKEPHKRANFSHQTPRQRSSPFFPEVHEELTKSWSAPYSSRNCPSASAALTSIDGAEEKGYERLHPTGWVRGHASLPTQGYWMEGEGEPYVHAVQSHFCTH